MAEPKVFTMEEFMKQFQAVLTPLAQQQQLAPTVEGIPRNILDAIDPWSPEKMDEFPLTYFFSVLEDLTTQLDQNQRLAVLRMKLRGSAQHFIVENPGLKDGPTPYNNVKAALLRWYAKDDPDKLAQRLWTLKKLETETIRQFAERTRRLAQRLVVAEHGGELDGEMRRTINAKAVRAFVRGLAGQIPVLMAANIPDDLETAVSKAEELCDLLNISSETTEKDQYCLNAIRSGRSESANLKCWFCGEVGHVAVKCPNGEANLTNAKTSCRNQADLLLNRPSKPCVFCRGWSHFAIHCPQKPVCSYCGNFGHLDEHCSAMLPYQDYLSRKIRSPPQYGKPWTSKTAEKDRKTEALEPQVPTVSAIGAPLLRVQLKLNQETRSVVVDTGAQASVLNRPVSGIPIEPTMTCATAADGRVLELRGQQIIDVKLGSHHIRHPFLILSERSHGLDLLGLDFLQKIPLLIDLTKMRLIPLLTNSTISKIETAAEDFNLFSTSVTKTQEYGSEPSREDELPTENWENLEASSPDITKLHLCSRTNISETITDRPRTSGSTTEIEFSRQTKDFSQADPVLVSTVETTVPSCTSVTKTGSKQTPTLRTSPSIRDRNQKILKPPPAHLPDGRIDHLKCCEVCNQPGTSMRSWRCSACYHFWDRLIQSCKVGQPPPSCDHAIYVTSCRGCRRRRYEYLEGHRNPDFILPEPRPPNAAVDIGLQRRGECNGKMPPPPTA
ncbi:Hypothetical protein NTJ_09899 [Nesidiocoris tenuis]|uniref:CCHC-type domain-containing protein n=1 Tax=Nesidiocoris tenuis TaxID=355587 RepID=A0ABN7AY26_9HEMI|nr:Hypothetical protein NTJ_09899 [Nesidiocoris tenuis]